jgi:hypothetical protein
MIDLWPDDIEHTSVKPPVAILKEQGTLLGRKTSNLVEGVVHIVAHDSQEHFEYNFYLRGRALDYHYRLLKISHPVDLYPLDIETDRDVLGELPAGMKDEYDILIADSEDRFIEILRAIFATKKVRRVIEAIIAQSSVGIEVG